MIRTRTLFRSMGILLALVAVSPAHAKMLSVTMLELAEQSDVVFVGKVTAVGEDAAAVTIGEMLSGNLDEDAVSVSPIQMQHCVGRFINFTTDEEVLIFARKTNGKQVVVSAGGQGKLKLDPEGREMTILAAKRMLVMAPLDEHEKNKAMMALIRSPNERLRAESHNYIVSRLSHGNLRDEYRDDLVSLISDADPEIQRTGLQGIRFVQAHDAIPRMVELTRSENVSVVSAASMALGQYDTVESVSALIALTQHPDPQIRIRASIDIDNSRRPEAKRALIELLDDKDPKVRAMGPRGLVYWLRRNEADEILPKLVEMLDDADSEVRASAADRLGECRNSELVPPLLAALKREPQDEKMNRAVYGALYCHYSKGDSKARELIDKDIELIISALKSGGASDAFGPSFQAVGILSLSPKPEAKDALTWAVRSHPNEEIRAYAKRSLPE